MSNAPRVRIEDIKRIISLRYSLPPLAMRTACRLRRLAYPRQVAMYFARKLTTNSCVKIGQLFGGRDHSTVLHAVRKITRKSERHALVELELNSIERALLEDAATRIRSQIGAG